MDKDEKSREEFLSSVAVRKTFAGFSSNQSSSSSSSSSKDTEGLDVSSATGTGSNNGLNPNSHSIENSNAIITIKQQHQHQQQQLFPQTNENNIAVALGPFSNSQTTIGPTGFSSVHPLDTVEDTLLLSQYQKSLTHNVAVSFARQSFERGGRSMSFSDFRILDSHVIHQRQYLSKLLRLEYSSQRVGPTATGSAPLVRRPSMRKDVTESLENLERKDIKAQSWKATKSPIPVSGMENHRGSISAPSSSGESSGGGSAKGESGDLLNVRPVSAREKLGLFIRRGQKGNRPSHSYQLHLLHLAIRDKTPGLAEELCKTLKIAAIKKKCFDEMNLTFLLALNEGFEGCIKTLMEKGFPSNVNRPIVSRLKKGMKRKYLPVFPSYFMIAVGQGHLQIVESMIKKGANVNQSWMGLRPIMLASYCNGVGSGALVKLLLDNGADATVPISVELFSCLRKFRFSQFITNLSPNDGSRSNFFNVNSSKNKILLVANEVKTKVIYPVEIAAAVGNMEAVSFIIGSKTDPSKYVPRLSFGLLCQQDLNISIRLLKSGALPNVRDSFNNTPLHFAARIGNIELVAVYIYFHADMNSLNDLRNTPLHEAIMAGQRKMVRFLIQKGADVSISNNNNMTPVQLALKHGYSSEDIVEYFERHSATSADEGSLEKINVKELLQRVKSITPDISKKGSFLSKSRRMFTIEKFGAPITKALRGVVSSASNSNSNNYNNSLAKSLDSLSSGSNSSGINLDSIDDIAAPKERRGRTMSTQDSSASQKQQPVAQEKRPRALSFGFRKGKDKSNPTISTAASPSSQETSKNRKGSISEEPSASASSESSSSSGFTSKFGTELFKLFSGGGSSSTNSNNNPKPKNK